MRQNEIIINPADVLKKGRSVILANGEFPSSEPALSVLYNSGFLVCCDGAVSHLEAGLLRPDAVVGDCDSLTEELKKKYADIIYKDSDQDYNDLTKAVNYCVSKGIKDLVILGATGKREDHSIANVSLLADYALLFGSVCLVSDHGMFYPVINTKSVFKTFKGQQVSIFSITPCKVTAEGLKFTVKDSVFNSWWQATLNESVADEFSISTDGSLVIYLAFSR